MQLPYLRPNKLFKNVPLSQSRTPLVYFFVCNNGMVIYVGKTDRFATRWKQHIMSDKAMHLVSRVELHVMNSEAEAQFYETEMIIKYAPLWNSMGRYAKPSTIAMQPAHILHFNTTPITKYILPFCVAKVNDYVVKHFDKESHTDIDFHCQAGKGRIRVSSDLSSCTVEQSVDCEHFKELHSTLDEWCSRGVELDSDSDDFVDMVVPDRYTKCLWNEAIKREKTKDFVDYSEYNETGITWEYPRLASYTSDIDHVANYN